MLKSFSGRITLMILLGISVVSFTVSAVVLSMSQRIFTQTYGDFQEQVFTQVETDLNEFHNDMQSIMDAIDSSWAFRLYLTGNTESDNVQNFMTTYQMEKDLESSMSDEMERMSILVVGMKGNDYLSRTETISESTEEILKSEAVQKALDTPEAIHYTYSKGAYTATSRNTDVIIVSKALYYSESREVYGIVLITLSMDDLLAHYDYFVTENSSWYLVNDSNIVMCSSERGHVGETLNENWFSGIQNTSSDRISFNDNGKYLTVLQADMSYLDAHMYGVIDNRLAIQELYNVPVLVLICFVIGLFVLVICLIFMRRTLNPLSGLVERMSTSRSEEFMEPVPVEGTTEVQNLAVTYNEMLEDIRSYVDELMETQRAQRKAEIKALQMQINPHYIYNTLAGIKMLVYQQDTEKAVQTIDAFISLLRNTISDTKEFITIEQEIDNLENYVIIHSMRYGDRIRVDYDIDTGCYDCLLPKMVLQPFVENAYFHAFPSGQDGMILISMNESEGRLIICITDNGIGMEQAKADRALSSNKEHFSGIGMHNVAERLRLLYGDNYGVQIESHENKGTTVTVTVPVMRD